MNKEMKWYAVYTRPKWEKKVAHLLEKKGVEHYCPLYKVIRQWSDRKKMVQEPLFTSYVFVRVTEADHLKVIQTEGVLNLVYWLSKPAIIKDAEIDTIKKFLHKYQNISIERSPVKMNDKVQVTYGPLINMEGHVIEIMTNSVKVLLPSLGYTMTAKVQKSHIEKMPVQHENTHHFEEQ